MSRLLVLSSLDTRQYASHSQYAEQSECHFGAGIVEVTGSISSFIGNIAMGWTIEETGEDKNTRGN